MQSGWHQVAFERDVRADLTRVERLGRPMMLVRRGDTIRAFWASCPHRGANLACGGALEGDAIRCPFHGHRVGLAPSAEARFVAQALPTLVIGGLVFVRDPDAPDRGFEAWMRALDASSFVVPGFEMRILAEASLVIENAFDAAHFHPVHGVRNHPRFDVDHTAAGALRARGELELPPSPWRHAHRAPSFAARVPFEAIAFGPHLVASTTGGERPYTTLTAVTPTGDRASLVRVSMAIPAGAEPPTRDDCLFLLQQSKSGLEKDQVIWEHIEPSITPRYTEGDDAVIAFRRFAAVRMEPRS